MTHPLTPVLREMKDEDLLKKINELYKRLRQAYYMPNSDIGMQLRMLLDDYYQEYNRRMAEQAEKFAQQNPKYADRIDIN